MSIVRSQWLFSYLTKKLDEADVSKSCLLYGTQFTQF